MTEWLGGLLSLLPVGLVLPVAFILVTAAWFVWIFYIEGGELYDRWRDRRRREKELKHGKS